MKRLLLIIWMAVAAATAGAQKLAIGEKAPEPRVREWLDGRSPADNSPRLLEFFYTRSTPCLERLPTIEALAARDAGRMTIALVCREEADAVRAVLGGGQISYVVALDDAGRTFTAYGVKYVPFGALLDARGRILWFGNPASLNGEQIDKLLK